VERRAEYERRYGRTRDPAAAAERGDAARRDSSRAKAATIRGSYRLVNRHAVPIRSVHLEPAFDAETRVRFDRAARVAVADDVLGHHVYALDDPLRPGDSLTLGFDVRLEPRGFRNGGPRSSGRARRSSTTAATSRAARSPSSATSPAASSGARTTAASTGCRGRSPFPAPVTSTPA
jgi:hypothetical protein